MLNTSYLDLYTNFKDEMQQILFSSLHYVVMKQYKLMNQRLPTGDNTAHFWADPSRKLLFDIETIYELERSLNGTLYNFKVEDTYAKNFKKSLTFLKISNGSTLPPFMEKIEIYETIPIFVSRDHFE